MAPCWCPSQAFRAIQRGRRLRFLCSLFLLMVVFLLMLTSLRGPADQRYFRNSHSQHKLSASERRRYLDELLSEVENGAYVPSDAMDSRAPVHKPACQSLNSSRARNNSQMKSRFLAVNTQGRLGNHMFAYASLLGIAERNRMIPTLSKESPIRKYFKITAAECELEQDADWVVFMDQSPCAYDPQTEKLIDNANIALLGYFQSWKYFENVKKLIQQEFRFKDEIVKSANQFISDSLRHYSKAPSKRTVLIGVHIRRGDMLETYNIDKGYTVATVQYLKSAIAYFSSQYDSERLLFVVCSDEMSWVKANQIFTNTSQIVYSNSTNEATDLAILSSCNHVIMTVGTYSWWSAWLAGGKTLFYKHYPEPYTLLADIFDADDYFYPGWIGL